MNRDSEVLSQAIGQPQERIGLARRLGVDNHLSRADHDDVRDVAVGDRDLADRNRRCQWVCSAHWQIDSYDWIGLER